MKCIRIFGDYTSESFGAACSNGLIVRVSDEEAALLTSLDLATYTTKGTWKSQRVEFRRVLR